MRKSEKLETKNRAKETKNTNVRCRAPARVVKWSTVFRPIANMCVREVGVCRIRNVKKKGRIKWGEIWST